MTLNSKDWKRLKQPVILLLAVLFLLSMSIYYAYAFCENQWQAAQTQAQALQAARIQLQTSDAEKNTIDTFLPKYEALINQGFIGEERRHTWIEALSDIQKSHQLFEIHYELGQLEAFNAPYLSNFLPFMLHQSSMNMHFDLLHEGDLLTFTEALKNKHLSPWILKSCEITKTNVQSAPLARLHAQCEIDWLTLAEPPQTQGALSP